MSEIGHYMEACSRLRTELAAAEARITELEAALEVAALEIIAWQKHAGVFDYPEHRKIIERIDAFLVTKEDTDE